MQERIPHEVVVEAVEEMERIGAEAVATGE
jgi:hypothetical protein